MWDCTFYTSPLELLYAETPKTDQLLKDFATKAATSHVKELVNSPELADLCKKNGEIEFDVLKVSFSLEVTKQCPSCPKCSALEVIALTLFVGFIMMKHSFEAIVASPSPGCTANSLHQSQPQEFSVN